MVKTEKHEYRFRTVEGDRIDDVVDYIIKKTLTHPDSSVYVGVDSKVKSKSTYYAIVIGIRYPGKGVHIIYAEKHGRKFSKADVEQRLWLEVEYAVDLGLYLRDRLSKPVTVHIDINPNPSHLSNKLYAASTGWLKGTGLPYATKPHAVMAMRAADFLTYANDRY